MPERLNLAHWSRLWSELDLRGDPAAWHTRLLASYAEPHRKYHNREHLAECLAMFDSLNAAADQLVVAEFALWFHDAVYDPQAGDNEEKSAEWAVTCLRDATAPDNWRKRVSDLILATKTHCPTSIDGKIVCDADLAILGQAPERFWRYEDAIAEEYGWVPRDVFRVKRTEILERFLQRPVLYHTTAARDRFERQARINLADAITRLRSTRG